MEVPMHHAAWYPRPSLDTLKQAFVGKNLSQAPTPVAVVDRAVVVRNCSQMLRACQNLGVQFRAHVKTHKVKMPICCFLCFAHSCYLSDRMTVLCAVHSFLFICIALSCDVKCIFFWGCARHLNVSALVIGGMGYGSFRDNLRV